MRANLSTELQQPIDRLLWRRAGHIPHEVLPPVARTRRRRAAVGVNSVHWNAQASQAARYAMPVVARGEYDDRDRGIQLSLRTRLSRYQSNTPTLSFF